MPVLSKSKLRGSQPAALYVPAPGGGGGFVACSGTNITPTLGQDDLGGWSLSSATIISGQSDPLGGTSASLITLGLSGPYEGIDNITSAPLTGGVEYSMKAYFKPIAGSTWIKFGISDFVANAFLSWFNLSGAGAVGTSVMVGDGTLSCARITTSTNGYYLISIGGQYAATNSSARISIGLTDADNDDNGTSGQQICAWHVGTP